jgi:hypothetical protein
MCGPDSTDSGEGSLAGFCEHGNEPFEFNKVRELCDQLMDYELLT